MDFKKYDAKVPTKVGDIEIRIINKDSVLYKVDLVDDDDNLISTEVGNLVPFLTLAQTTDIQSFMASVRTKVQKFIS